MTIPAPSRCQPGPLLLPLAGSTNQSSSAWKPWSRPTTTAAAAPTLPLYHGSGNSAAAANSHAPYRRQIQSVLDAVRHRYTRRVVTPTRQDVQQEEDEDEKPGRPEAVGADEANHQRPSPPEQDGFVVVPRPCADGQSDSVKTAVSSRKRKSCHVQDPSTSAASHNLGPPGARRPPMTPLNIQQLRARRHWNRRQHRHSILHRLMRGHAVVAQPQEQPPAPRRRTRQHKLPTTTATTTTTATATAKTTHSKTGHHLSLENNLLRMAQEKQKPYHGRVAVHPELPEQRRRRVVHFAEPLVTAVRKIPHWTAYDNAHELWTRRVVLKREAQRNRLEYEYEGRSWPDVLEEEAFVPILDTVNGTTHRLHPVHVLTSPHLVVVQQHQQPCRAPETSSDGLPLMRPLKKMRVC